MRKLFWGTLVGGVLITAGVCGTVHVGCKYPESLVGRFLHGAQHAATAVNSDAGTAPVAKKAEADVAAVAAVSAGKTPDVEGIPDDPVPATEPEKMPAAPSGAILIPEDPMPEVAAAQRVLELLHADYQAGPVGRVAPPSGDVLPAVATGPAFAPHTEVPPAAVTPVGAAFMPYCEEPCEEESSAAPVKALRGLYEKIHMPKATDAPESLGMPRAEEEQEEAQETGTGTGPANASSLLKLLEKSVRRARFLAPDECREDAGRDVQLPGCPSVPGGFGKSASGRVMYLPPIPASELKPRGDEEEQEPTCGRDESLRGLLMLKRLMRGEVEMRTPMNPGVDTMEMRPSDATATSGPKKL